MELAYKLNRYNVDERYTALNNTDDVIVMISTLLSQVLK